MSVTANFKNSGKVGESGLGPCECGKGRAAFLMHSFLSPALSSTGRTGWRTAPALILDRPRCCCCARGLARGSLPRCQSHRASGARWHFATTRSGWQLSHTATDLRRPRRRRPAPGGHPKRQHRRVLARHRQQPVARVVRQRHPRQLERATATDLRRQTCIRQRAARATRPALSRGIRPLGPVRLGRRLQPGPPMARVPARPEQAALQCLYLAIISLDPTGRGRQRWLSRWMAALNDFHSRRSAGRKLDQEDRYTRNWQIPVVTRPGRGRGHHRRVAAATQHSRLAGDNLG
jgi:hypothetical protein